MALERLLSVSIGARIFVILAALVAVVLGVNAAITLPVDAVPDISSNQVQINVLSTSFSPMEMERYATVPVETAMGNLPRKEEIRSISKFGLSQVTVVFRDDVDLYWARQLVAERLAEVQENLPPGLMKPEMAPISTGLGEIFQFYLEGPDRSPQTLRRLHTILHWDIKPQLAAVPGVTEMNCFGGLEKQYVVYLDPLKLSRYGIPVRSVVEALHASNSNMGGAFIERGGEQLLIRGLGMLSSDEEIGKTVLSVREGVPIRVADLASVSVGSRIRQGAATVDGRGEVAAGVPMLLKGENSRIVCDRLRKKMAVIEKALPPDVKIHTYYDRSGLINGTLETVRNNLLEGGLLVVAVLFLFLGSLRSGLIVASAIPLSLVIALIGMKHLGISANLMSLGALDFGLLVDGAVIMTENSARRLWIAEGRAGTALSAEGRRAVIHGACCEVLRPAVFGMFIILTAYCPVLFLGSIEGKMFKPMAMTVILALTGATLLCLTLIPALLVVLLRGGRSVREPAWIERMKGRYISVLEKVLRRPWPVFAVAVLSFAVGIVLFTRLGAEFLPELDEGAIAINTLRPPGLSLQEAIARASTTEGILKEFPEVKTVVTRIGTPEIPTDPMGPEMCDFYVMLHPRGVVPSARSRTELVALMEERLKSLPGAVNSFSMPIKLRMMEDIEGTCARSDVVIKLFGEDLDVLRENAERAAALVSSVRGASDVRVEQVSGLPLLEVKIRRDVLGRYGLRVADVQEVIETAVAGKKCTELMEGFKRFDLVVRMEPGARSNPEALGNLAVMSSEGSAIPLAQVADIRVTGGPSQVSRENGMRRVSVEINVRGRDIDSFVREATAKVERKVKLPAGYWMTWSGTFEYLEEGRRRLAAVVPLTFLFIFFLLYGTFGSARQALLIFTGIPLAVTGGVLALYLRHIYFSMSAGVGFIALFGVAVLNGIVMVTFINSLLAEGRPLQEAVVEGAASRLRPVLMTALVASLGFLPMALSTGTGAEVQRPLATVVIGGLITSTLLTLVVLPALYYLWERHNPRPMQAPPECVPPR
jgi:cobalt-zinc-cadmium resistance protein CzcA